MVKIIDAKAEEERKKQRFSKIAEIALEIWGERAEVSEPSRILIYPDSERRPIGKIINIDVPPYMDIQVRVPEESYFDDAMHFSKECERKLKEEVTLSTSY